MFNRTKRVIAAALLTLPILTFASVGHAEVREIKPIVLDDDDGGNVDTFVTFYNRIRASGVPVRVRGICVSACTIVLSLPQDQVCIESTASFGFHLAATGGHPDPDFTKAMQRRYYPPSIQNWLKDKTLTPHVIYMLSDEAVGLGAIRWCDPPPDEGE